MSWHEREEGEQAQDEQKGIAVRPFFETDTGEFLGCNNTFGEDTQIESEKTWYLIYAEEP